MMTTSMLTRRDAAGLAKRVAALLKRLANDKSVDRWAVVKFLGKLDDAELAGM
jgi:HEAT repeat protein